MEMFSVFPVFLNASPLGEWGRSAFGRLRPGLLDQFARCEKSLVLGVATFV